VPDVKFMAQALAPLQVMRAVMLMTSIVPALASLTHERSVAGVLAVQLAIAARVKGSRAASSAESGLQALRSR
jgi:hypothetical protein